MAAATEVQETQVVNFNTAQCRTWRARYFTTISNSNKAVLERVKVLVEIRTELEEDYLDFFRDEQFGLGLSAREIESALDLLLAFDRYPDPLLWESLGSNMTRLPRIEDARIRTNVVRRCRTIAQYDNGHISGSKLTRIIEDCDPRYYEKHPSERRQQKMAFEAEKEELESEAQTHARAIKEAIRRLQADGYSLEEARSFFTKTSLAYLDK